MRTSEGEHVCRQERGERRSRTVLRGRRQGGCSTLSNNEAAGGLNAPMVDEVLEPNREEEYV